MLTNVIPASALAAGLVLLAGCSPGGKKVEDFTPAADHARKAVEAALTHLQAGKPPGDNIPGTSPVVALTDTKWKATQPLKGFEVLGEDTPAGSNARHFKVRLTPAKGSPVETKYVVIGIEPLLVYREDDFKALSGVGK